MWGKNGSGCIEKIYLICLDKLFDSTAQLGNDVIFALVDLCPVKARVFGVKSKQFEVSCFFVKLRRVQHCFGRNAAAVEAGAADLTAFNQCGVQTQLCGADGGFISARAGADNDQLILFHVKIPLGRCSTKDGSSNFFAWSGWRCPAESDVVLRCGRFAKDAAVPPLVPCGIRSNERTPSRSAAHPARRSRG